jgi:hypothetical protein
MGRVNTRAVKARYLAITTISETLDAGTNYGLSGRPNVHHLIARQVISECLSFGRIQVQGLYFPHEVNVCASFASEFDVSDVPSVYDGIRLDPEQF